MVLRICPHSGYPNYLSSTLLRQQTPFLQKKRSYGYAKKLTVGKAASELKENTCTQGPRHANILAWVLKKVVFSLLPSEYRTRAPSVSAPIFSLVILVFINSCLPNFSQHYFNVYLSFFVKDDCFLFLWMCKKAEDDVLANSK